MPPYMDIPKSRLMFGVMYIVQCAQTIGQPVDLRVPHKPDCP